MSLLTIVSNAMVLSGFSAPTTVYSNTDATTVLFKTLAQVEGDILSRSHAWRGLKTAAQWTGDGTTVLFALPAGFQRFMTAYPIWLDESPGLPLMKVTDDEMLAAKVAVSNPSRPVWRLKGEYVEFYPAPENGDVVKYEYLSSYWISGLAEWTSDANTCVIPERLITLGCIWRYKQAKGFDYGEDFRTYQIECAKERMTDGGRQVIQAQANFMSDYTYGGFSDPRVTP